MRIEVLAGGIILLIVGGIIAFLSLSILLESGPIAGIGLGSILGIGLALVIIGAVYQVVVLTPRKRRKGRFEIKRSKDNQFYFVQIAPNGEIIATSEMYKEKRSCKKGVEALKRYAPIALVEDQTLKD